MKICILLSGHLRTYKKTIDSWKKNILDFDNIDIFIHTWDIIDRDTQSWYKTSGYNLSVPFKSCFSIT